MIARAFVASTPACSRSSRRRNSAAGEQISLGESGANPILQRKCVARIVVALHVGIAKCQHVIGIDVALSTPSAALLEKWNRLLNVAQTEETHAMHLHRFVIGGILVGGLGEGVDRVAKLFALIEDDAAQTFDADGFRRLAWPADPVGSCLVETAFAGKFLGGCQSGGGSRSAVGRGLRALRKKQREECGNR